MIKSELILKTTKLIKRKNFEKEIDGEITFISTSEESGIFISRANDLANIIAYDKEHYGDVNIETLIRAAELAGLIESNEQTKISE